MKKKLHSFSTNYQSIFIFCFALLFNVGLINGQTEIGLNGGFETGDFTDWESIGAANQVITTNPSVGTYCAELNQTAAGASLLKNANIGIGTVAPGQEVTITLDARGTTANGGVAFVEFFSELSGGGVSASALFGPLSLDPDPNTWKSFSFTTTTGPDVSGGVTLQLTATAGAVAGVVANLFYDNISVTVTEPEPSARVQVIHNSADAAASLVDVYLDGVLTLDDFAFRTASPFIDVPADTPISVAVAPSTSTSVGDAIATFPYTLTDGETYVLVADGIVSPTGYNPGAATAAAFDIKVYPMGRETAGASGNTDLLVHHGSTDAPTVDVNEVSGPSVLVDNISYGEFDPNGYLELPTADYTINISTADGVTVVASYDAPLATLNLGDAAAVVVASGFLDPSVNSDGPAFGLWVALPQGGALLELLPGGSNITEPTVAAPTPTPLPSQVISLFSNAYTDVSVDTWKTPWSAAGNLTDIVIEGSDVKKYEDVDFLGIEFAGMNAINATAYDYFHVDVWSINATLFRVKLVDAAGGGEGELAYTIPQGEWVSLDIPFTDFADNSQTTGSPLTARTEIFQLIFSGQPIGEFDFFVDNIYFSEVQSLSTDDVLKTAFKTYPNPTQDSWTIETQNENVQSIRVFDILGKNVLSLTPNSNKVMIDGSNLKAGLYFAQVKTAKGLSSLKLVKQ